MLGSSNQLTSTGNERLDRMQRLTSPGMIDWVDLHGDGHCAGCRHYARRHCMLFVRLMRARLKNSNFLGPKLPHGQRACRKYEASPRSASGAGKCASNKGDNDMASVSQRYGRRSFINAADVEHGDLTVQISHVDLDQEINGKMKDIVRFENSEQSLVLNQANAITIASLYGDDTDGWRGKWITLFYDASVRYEDKETGETRTGGLRVRPYVTKLGDGPKPGKAALDDEIPW